MAFVNINGPFVMGIDFGTESCRVAIFDLEGHPISFAATPYKTHYPRPGWAEQSPDDWWNALMASTRKAMDNAYIPPQSIGGISYDATTMTVVPMDKNGNALRNAIMWMDVRATEQAERALTSDSWARLYNGGGTMPATAEWYPFKAAWLRENERDVYDAAYRLVDAPDWLTYRLTGTWSVNINSAALRMYYNRDHGGWPEDFYAHVGAGDVFDKLPETVNDLGVLVGELSTVAARDLGLVPGTPVAQGLPDAWAGQIGLGVVSPGKLALITGSSHVITGQSAVAGYGEGFFGSYTDGVIRGQYTVEGGISSSGSVLKWFKENFGGAVAAEAEATGMSPYYLWDRKADELPIGCDGLIVNEYFQGNRTPYTDSKARGIFSGLSLGHTAAHLYRAIEEGVCYDVAHNLLKLRQAGIKTKELVACGGATKSRQWMQMHADVTGVPITLTEVGDAVVLGSCMLAAVGSEFYSSIEDAAANMVHVTETIEPNPEAHEEYQFYFQTYMERYPALREQIHSTVDHLNANAKN